MRRFKPSREFFRMAGQLTVRPKECPEVEIWIAPPDATGKLSALAFSGKRQKPDFYVRFQNRANLDAYLSRYLDGIKQRQEYRQKQQAARKGGQHPFKVGDVLTGSWGYDQTNQEIWGVTRAEGKRIWIRPLACRDEGSEGQSNCLLPTKGKYLDKPEEMKIPQTYDGGQSWYVRCDCFTLTLWDGRALYETDSRYGH